MSAIDWFFSIGTIAAHTGMLAMLIWCNTSFILRSLSSMLIARIFMDYVLLVPMSDITYFWLYYAFEIVGFFLFVFAYFECKDKITKSYIHYGMLVYLIPEAVHIIAFVSHHFSLACKFADIMRPFYLLCLLYMCSILYSRKGNQFNGRSETT